MSRPSSTTVLLPINWKKLRIKLSSMKKISSVAITLVVAALFFGLKAQSFKMDLYPEGQIPNYKASDLKERWDSTDVVRISNVQMPDITVFLPSKKISTGQAVIICPGGGYRILAYDLEGEDIAKFWNSKGIAAIVLKYRLPNENQVVPYKSPLMDAQRAMRMVRFHAVEWNIDPEKIGIMGFSAGGHLASTLSTHYDTGNLSSKDPVERMSCRPDFSILVYPVITFTRDFQHSGSHHNLLGENPDVELSKHFSNELQITDDTPPAILIHASDDRGVPVDNSIVYYKALVNHGINTELHVYSKGGHGFGLASGKDHLSGWSEQCYEWLRSIYR